MSESNSDTTSVSTMSDNNNGHWEIHRVSPYELPENPELDIYNSSDSEFDNHSDYSLSESDVLLYNSSEESDCLSNSSSPSSRSSSLFPLFPAETNGNKIKVTSKHNHWSIPKELYKREIGNYNNSAKWSQTFYQSTVAVQKLKLSKQLNGHKRYVHSLDFNKTGDIIVSGSNDYRMCLWNWSMGQCLLEHTSFQLRNLCQTKFLTIQGDIHIISSDMDGIIMLHVVANGDVHSKVLARHNNACYKVGVHPDHPHTILSCGEDGVIKNIDVRQSLTTENDILYLNNASGGVMHLFGIDINPMNPFEFIICGEDKFVRMYDKRKITSDDPVKQFYRILPTIMTNSDDDEDLTDPRVRSTSFDPSYITSAVYNYCGTEILASYNVDDIYLFDINGLPNTYLRLFSGHSNRSTIRGVNFYGPRSEYVISGSDCGCIFIWDKKSEAIVQRKHADVGGVVTAVVAHPHIPILASSGRDETIKIWEPLNKWQHPNEDKIKMGVVNNRVQRIIDNQWD